jgi:hypothetical protein
MASILITDLDTKETDVDGGSVTDDMINDTFDITSAIIMFVVIFLVTIITREYVSNFIPKSSVYWVEPLTVSSLVTLCSVLSRKKFKLFQH